MFGVSDTLQCLEMGAVETLIVWENLEACPALPWECCSITRASVSFQPMSSDAVHIVSPHMPSTGALGGARR